MNISTQMTARHAPSRLTVFTFIWAGQALVHQDFFREWFEQGSVFGWLATLLAVATLLYPRSLLLFSGFLTSNLIYNFGRWPFVANHILLEFLVELTILSAIVFTMYRERQSVGTESVRIRDEIYDRFAPVLVAMMVVLYYIIFVSKLNWDFVNLDYSCLTGMYHDVVDRFAGVVPVPLDRSAIQVALWAFLAIEILLPVMLTFRKTRYAAIVIALPFHLLLGLIGHRTFSAFIFGLYGLLCMAPLVELLGDLRSRLSTVLIDRCAKAARIIVAAIAVALIIIYLVGVEMDPKGPFSVTHIGYSLWFLWSCVVGLAYVAAIFRTPHFLLTTSPTVLGAVRPGWLWVFLGIAIFNGFSPYLGLKTETSYSMYSNLRTEGGVNNHMFMPALRLTGYQDDLVEIIATDHPMIQRMSEWYPLGDRTRSRHQMLVPYFELRRIVSETDSDFYVEYIRNGERHQFARRNGSGPDVEVARKQNFLLRKLLRFRPVFATDESYCQH